MILSFRKSPLPLVSWIFIAVVSVAAIIMLFYLTEQLISKDWNWKWWEILIWAILVVVAEKFVITTPRGGAFVTVTAALDFAIIVLYGPWLAIWFGLLEAVVSSGFARKVPFYKLLFNSAQYILTAGFAAIVYVALGGVVLRSALLPSIPYSQLAIPFIVCVPTYFFINNALTCSIIGLTEKISPLRVWYVDFKWTVSHDLILAPLGLVVALLFARYGWLAIFSIFAPLALARYVYKLYMDLRDAYFDSIAALASALDASDPYTRGHSDRVTEYAKKVARAMGLSEQEIESIEFAGRLHDIGKIGIDRSILRKRSRLNDREYREMQKHPNMGAEIAGKLKFLKKAEGYVSHHHERYDGQGYPDGIKGKEIPIGARILGVVDAFDAMTSDRPYRPALSVDIAVQELEKGTGKQFDPKIVKIFIELIGDGTVCVEEHKVDNK
jgi:hypothetical protein